jgi:hypothetical protein
MRVQVVTPHDIARACEGAKDAFDRLIGLLSETRAA